MSDRTVQPVVRLSWGLTGEVTTLSRTLAYNNLFGWSGRVRHALDNVLGIAFIMVRRLAWTLQFSDMTGSNDNNSTNSGQPSVCLD